MKTFIISVINRDRIYQHVDRIFVARLKIVSMIHAGS